MKTLLLSFLFVTNILAYESDHWLHDYNKALSLAQKTHKKIYLFIGPTNATFAKCLRKKHSQKKM